MFAADEWTPHFAHRASLNACRTRSVSAALRWCFRRCVLSSPSSRTAHSGQTVVSTARSPSSSTRAGTAFFASGSDVARRTTALVVAAAFVCRLVSLTLRTGAAVAAAFE